MKIIVKAFRESHFKTNFKKETEYVFENGVLQEKNTIAVEENVGTETNPAIEMNFGFKILKREKDYLKIEAFGPGAVPTNPKEKSNKFILKIGETKSFYMPIMDAKIAYEITLTK